MKSAKKPPHRPSRRADVVAAAMGLFAEAGSDAVTVARIAHTAEMTSAAVYYHFASKEDILLEGLREIGGQLVVEAARLADEVTQDPESIGGLPVGLLRWADGRPVDARVWFVSSSGVSQTVEQLRREQRGQLMDTLMRCARQARPRLSAPENAVVATALLSLLEVSANMWLSDDASVAHLARDGFLREVCLLAVRIAGD